MKRLLALLLSSVSLTWVQPANPGWNAGPTCGANPCLQSYSLVDTSFNQTFTVPYGTALPYVLAAAPGTHNYSIVLNGKNAAGNAVSSTPPATTTVTVPMPYALTVCNGTMNTPTGSIAAGGQSKVVTLSCPGADSIAGQPDNAAWSFAAQPPSQAGLVPYVWVSANQLNMTLGNISNRAINVTSAVAVTVRCIR